MNDSVSTAMAREIAEIPAIAERLLARREELAEIAARIALARPRIVVICGRGSSGHVGVYLRYLLEVRYGVLVSAAAPSVITTYLRLPDMRETLFIVVTQSGRSPDIVVATRAARSLGALTLALVNDEASPAAEEAELVFPIGAGLESSVAATKTVALTMMAGAQLVAALTKDHELDEALSRLPGRLSDALACDWSGWGNRLTTASAAFVAARGYGLGTAREVALKLTETLRLPALGYSTAELRHGPRAAIAGSTPVLVLRQRDETAATSDDLVRDLRAAGNDVFSAGGPDATLPWLEDDHPVADPIAMLLPAYRAIEMAARCLGLDPDRPLHLTKVTQTL
jgi:glucosamine--fructose-6-phosphate aminotransferase (isomerizing)